MANYKVAVENGNNILVTIDRGVSGVGIENIETVFISPDYFLKFFYTNGTNENVLLPATEATVLSFNTRIGVVTLNSADVTSALGYTPPTPTGTGATGTWGISVSGNAATATNVPYTGLTGTVPTWNQDTTGNAATVTNGVYTTDTGTVTNTMLAGSIANNKLTNSAITINGGSTSLGGSVNVGTVTNVAATAGAGISVSGSPITSNGTLTITNTAPDQTVGLTGAGTSVITGTYPNFTVTSNDEFDGTVTSVVGTGTVNGISLSGAVTSSGNLTLGGVLTGVNLTSQVTGTLPVSNGGTGATTLTGYVKGTGTSPLIASGTIPNTDISGLGTIATQDANAVALTGGSVNGTTVGDSTASTGAFTALTSTTDATLSGLTVGKGAGAVASNTALGSSALNANTTGSFNTANGFQALYYNTTGSNNTASGLYALQNNTTGGSNTASGASALRYNTTGGSNTASGVNALRYNTTGSGNTASGYNALTDNTTGRSNTANGGSALLSNTTGDFNTANGGNALLNNSTGSSNTASGYLALNNNTTGNTNTASGASALRNNTTGVSNTASGGAALRYNTTGSNNTASGGAALLNNTTGSGNTAINPSNSAGTYLPVFNPTTENNRFCMGSTGVTNAYIQVAWTVVSDARDKTNFAPVPHGLEFVKALQPTAYQFRTARDSEETNGGVRYGFKAQDVLALEGANPVIVDNEDADKLRMVDSHMIPVLVKAIQELSAEVDNLKQQLGALK